MTDALMPAPAAHPDVEIVEAKTGFDRFLRLEVFRYRQRLYSGKWSPIRTYDVLRRGPAVAVVPYDPLRDSVVLVEQLRLPAMLASAAPWQVEIPAG
ncbi:MAG TPA: ADP-ribose diphosphatase, partial [Stellaceae bacterium]|nr:ADP-ribose diphosphatase [Stellaceae bacterium]